MIFILISSAKLIGAAGAGLGASVPFPLTGLLGGGGGGVRVAPPIPPYYFVTVLLSLFIWLGFYI